MHWFQASLSYISLLTASWWVSSRGTASTLSAAIVETKQSREWKFFYGRSIYEANTLAARAKKKKIVAYEKGIRVRVQIHFLLYSLHCFICSMGSMIPFLTTFSKKSVLVYSQFPTSLLLTFNFVVALNLFFFKCGHLHIQVKEQCFLNSV